MPTSQGDIKKQFNLSQDKVAVILKDMKLWYPSTFIEYTLREDKRQKYYKFSERRNPTNRFENLINITSTSGYAALVLYPLQKTLLTDFIEFLASPTHTNEMKISILYQIEKYIPSMFILREFYEYDPNFISDYLNTSQQEQKETLF